MRKKKKAKGESTTQAKARGNSVYNRFAGTSAPKSSTKTKGTGVVKPVSVGCLLVHATLLLITTQPHIKLRCVLYLLSPTAVYR